MSTKTLIQNPKLEQVIRVQVLDVFREILADPDFKLKLRLGIVKKLQRSIKDRTAGRYQDLQTYLKKRGF